VDKLKEDGMDRIVAMRSFLRAVETGSFTAVAREQGTSQPAVSKRIAWLEREIGARLLERRTRALVLTDAGTRFVERCRPLLGALDEAESCLGDARRGLGGLLRVACPVAFGRLHLIARLKKFRERHPGLHLDVHLSDQVDDLAREGIDLAIRVGNLQDPDLIANAVGSTRLVLVASPEYLRRQGVPHRLDDLCGHSCIVYTGHLPAGVWSFADEIGVRTIDVRGEFRTNSSEGVLCAAVDALGIAYAPLWLVDADLRAGRLHQVMRNAQTERLPIWAAKPSSRRHSASISALTDYLRHEFASDPLLAPIPSRVPAHPSARLPDALPGVAATLDRVAKSDATSLSRDIA
jgi:DNA-binding transcriptional LysR family regulator